MISTTLVGLGTTATAVGSFASEMYLAKKISGGSATLNHNYYSPPQR